MTTFSTFTRASLVLILLVVTPLFIPGESVLAQPLVDFDSFKLKKVRIKDKEKDFKDKLDFKGTFTLGAGREIDPANEEVTVTIVGFNGSIVFTQTIPPGSFKQKGRKRQHYEFKRKGKGKKKIGSSPCRVGNLGMILDLRKHAGEDLETQVLFIAPNPPPKITT